MDDIYMLADEMILIKIGERLKAVRWPEMARDCGVPKEMIEKIEANLCCWIFSGYQFQKIALGVSQTVIPFF